MKNIKDSFIILTISAIVLIGGLALLEKHFHNELNKMGWLPRDKFNLYPYGRKISGYTVTAIVPNYRLNAYDDNFKAAGSSTDSNGFLTDGARLDKQKDNNTIRIFVTGGSAAWGSIESRDFMNDTTYPSGTYCYKATIAGKLQKILKAKYPGLNFEVIDAAVVQFCFHQSVALYFEKLHDFSPDIIINLDGYNDMGNFNYINEQGGGDPYPNAMGQMEDDLEFSTMARLPQWPYMLAYYNFKYVRQCRIFFETDNFVPANISADNTIINYEPGHKHYEALRPYMKRPEKMLWLIRSYEQQLNSDGVYSIFCLQPTLQRRVYQKELSATEFKFRAFLDKVTVADTLNVLATMDANKKRFPLYQSIRNAVGTDCYWVDYLQNAYNFNELSPVLDSVVTANGGAYLDVNKAMTGIGSDKEFYVDYCHLTPFGNEFVAGLLAKKVEPFLLRRKLITD